VPTKFARNYAFVDSHNVYLGVKSAGWKLDFARFRVYLREKYGVAKAFLFIGYVAGNEGLYRSLQEAGYVCIFKPTLRTGAGLTKGNCDAEMVLQAMIELPNYDRAVIVSGDGDFKCLAEHLTKIGKLAKILAPTRISCSRLLWKLPRGLVGFLEDFRERLGR